MLARGTIHLAARFNNVLWYWKECSSINELLVHHERQCARLEHEDWPLP